MANAVNISCSNFILSWCFIQTNLFVCFFYDANVTVEKKLSEHVSVTRFGRFPQFYFFRVLANCFAQKWRKEKATSASFVNDQLLKFYAILKMVESVNNLGKYQF